MTRKDQLLRAIANKLHTIGWKHIVELAPDDDEIVYIEPRWGCSIARSAFHFVVQWRVYNNDRKTLLMLILDSAVTYCHSCGYVKSKEGVELLTGQRVVAYAPVATRSGAVYRRLNQVLLRLRWRL